MRTDVAGGRLHFHLSLFACTDCWTRQRRDRRTVTDCVRLQPFARTDCRFVVAGVRLHFHLSLLARTDCRAEADGTQLRRDRRSTAT